MKIGQIHRCPNLITTTALVDSLSNWYCETASPFLSCHYYGPKALSKLGATDLSTLVQKEALVDRHPLVLIAGKRLAGILRKYTVDHDTQLNELLNEWSFTHKSRIEFSDSESVMS